MPLSYIIKTAATANCVTASQVKDWTRVDSDADDSLIGNLIDAAEAYTVDITSRALVDATYTYQLEHFPHNRIIKLPVSPIDSVSSIKYYDANDTEQTFSSDDYTVDTVTDPGRVQLNEDASWPTTANRVDAVTIEFTAGYGDADDVPWDLRTAILMLVAHWYEHREAYGACDGVLHETPRGYGAIIGKYRNPIR